VESGDTAYGNFPSGLKKTTSSQSTTTTFKAPLKALPSRNAAPATSTANDAIDEMLRVVGATDDEVGGNDSGDAKTAADYRSADVALDSLLSEVDTMQQDSPKTTTAAAPVSSPATTAKKALPGKLEIGLYFNICFP
jgi:hypothetical protein